MIRKLKDGRVESITSNYVFVTPSDDASIILLIISTQL
jgi:hypothetical protein